MMYNFFMQEGIFDTIIIGSGPSGLSCAIYTARAMITTLVLAGNPAGGQLMLTSEVENYPGFPSGIMGAELIGSMRNQAERFGAKFVEENVTAISGGFENGFDLETDAGNKYSAKSVVIATGASARWLGLPSETKLRGKGVSACATCDGFFFKNKNIVVVGGGDAAFEEATYLTKYVNHVTMVIREPKEELFASKFMQEKAFANSKIEYVYEVEVLEILGNTEVTGVVVKNNRTGEETLLDNISGVFVAIGHKPNTSFLKDFIELEKDGTVKLYEAFNTSREGVFVCGDVSDVKYRQAITASGFGVMAAIDLTKFLAKHGVEIKSASY
jgi:thioredoxin reductase (NADPH)